MATGIVQSVEFNVAKTSKAGKNYTVTTLKYITDKGQPKTENAFSDCDYKDELAKLAPGDTIEVKYVKKDFKGKDVWNMVGVTLLSKGDGVAPSTTPRMASGGFKESPEKQASIERQNGLTNATMLVKTMVEKDLFKKAACTPDLLVAECIRIANKFQEFTSGKADLAALAKATEGAIPTDVPFDINEIPE